MFSYICSSCGAVAYSSANQATVGVCPRCSEPLVLQAEPDSTPAVAAAGAHRAGPSRLVRVP
jgi:DNA-directed RNA polymerase subunit RPC12/RpoP